MNNPYYKEDEKELDDGRIINDLKKAAEMYENGEIAEVRDILFQIVDAIDDFDIANSI